MYHFGRQSRGRADFSFRSRISQRDLLTHVPSSVETPVLSQNHADKKFRDVENLTDSDEEAMSEDTDNEPSRAKKRRLITDEGDKEPRAQWSNPDPYTALPPATDSSHKKVDVVKLIRKARNDMGGQQSTFAEQDDFISFGDFENTELFAPPENAPTGPRADTASHVKIDRSELRTGPVKKRKYDEFEDDTLVGHVTRTQYHRNGKVLAAWRCSADHGQSATPWLRSCGPHDSPMTTLHREILDFYEWVKPKEYEATIRQGLLDRLVRELRRWKPGGSLEAFGSYAAGLYLPTGDMDLVYNFGSVPKSFRTGPSQDVYKVARFLEGGTLARPGSVQPIAKAKVPIVKFVDDLTGLKVDLSFNNNTGVVANETFKKWQGEQNSFVLEHISNMEQHHSRPWQS